MHHNLPDMERVGCGRRETLGKSENKRRYWWRSCVGEWRKLKEVRRWRRSLSVQRVCEDLKGRERRERTGESLGIRLGMK
ncbi:hypothetical protein TIFTF001_033603 [Ficus carica]|uniref:Uncharacterized protein n=1 Tax=Ficus carica TaxID=3494 RepID=A0AA88E2C7_FICCA|nr:hypothetical protein TIFTF001_033603 [Ficus carica]